jgi:hypothetical protein
VEPNGEPGSTHVVACLPITEEAFDEFIANGFRMGKDTPTLIRNVVDAMSTIGEQMGEAGK